MISISVRKKKKLTISIKLAKTLLTNSVKLQKIKEIKLN